ncbi:MAG TPA: Ig domain-containing protein, partial [Thermoanaerobaculia bacterium]|nr:Ig domain-containing protein [Thermoanaerobaculia bacterium]
MRPASSFGNPNGFDGFNFQANNAGTSGGTEPTWPQAIGLTVGDNGITWTAIAFDPHDFSGCTPMNITSRAFGGAETTIAQEGDTLPDGSQLAGWNEFIAANGSGVAAFRAALAGYPYTDRDDEGESGIFTAGPGAGGLTRIAVTNTTIGTRSACGFSAMVGMNDAGQVVFDVLAGLVNNECDEDNHSIVRFSPGGPGNQLLVEVGSTIGSPSATVVGFGKDTDPGGGVRCSTCEYQNIDGYINSAGHVPVVLNLSDGTQGVFIFTGPLTATQVVRLPAGTIGPRTSINNNDQVVYRATTGGVDHLFRFTPPSTITTIVSVGDTFAGSAIQTIDAFSDINNSGNVVFKVITAAGEGYGYWDGAVTPVISAQPDTSLASEMITIDDANQVAYVTGISSGPDNTDGGAEMHENGGLFFWTKAGGSVKAIQVGDVIGGKTVSSIYAQHTSFAKRQFSSVGCAALEYHVGGDDPDDDCTEGATTAGCATNGGGQLFLSCAGAICPTITIAPPTLPAGTQNTAYNQTLIASGGAPPYTYAVTTGALPSGLTLSAGGTLSGTPTVQGTFPFTVTATDANTCTGSQAYSLVIGAPTQVTVALSPPSRTIVVGTNGSLSVTINITQSTDTIVTLSSANSGIVSVPASVTILANQHSASFSASGVTLGGPVTITATLPPSFNAAPATSAVTVIAPPAAAVPTVSVLGLAVIGVL